jgi:hypothetical protein
MTPIMNTDQSEQLPDPDDFHKDALIAERREALRKIASWTPPVMLTLLLSPRASAESPAANESTTPDPGNF